MATGYTIHVAGLASETTEEKLQDFFSFCGKVTSIKKDGNKADITFEKLSAMRTSLMLNGGTLDGAHLEVTSAAETASPTSSILPTGTTGSTPIGAADISQEDKPKAAIVAEYLAHGYVMGDHIVQRAIDLDHKQGISAKFLTFFDSLDKSVGSKVIGENKTVSGRLNEGAQSALAKTKEVDQNRGITTKFNDYYSKVMGTPIGQRAGNRVVQFYTTTQKQVLDVHEEAKRIAAEKKASAASTPVSPSHAGDVKAPEPSTSTTVPVVAAMPTL